ncbi:MAG: hypothetical protein NC082_03950 [Clostridiales bacterium]|nr:hypothetical protein [Clostridiales bacterium]
MIEQCLQYIKKITLVVLTTISTIAQANAQEAYDNDRYVISLNAGYYYEHDTPLFIEPSFSWFFNKNIGVSGGIEFTTCSTYILSSAFGDTSVQWENNASWFLLKPSVVFKSPYIWRSEIDGLYRLWVQCEAGLSLGVTSNRLFYDIYNTFRDPEIGVDGKPIHSNEYKKSKQADWLFFNARASVNFAFEHVMIGVGYGGTTLDYYSGRRKIYMPDGSKIMTSPKKRWTQTVFITLGYIF